MSFQWREAFRVGDETVDSQHRGIFELLAELHRSIHDRDCSDSVKIALKQLLNYTQEHFQDEERLMQAVGYPDYERHKELHDELMDQVWALYIRCNHGHQAMEVELLTFLNSWLVDHILERDKDIGRFIRDSGRPAPACGESQ